MVAGVLGVSIPWLLTGVGHGPDAPADAPALTDDVLDVLAQMRRLRQDISVAGDTLAGLENRLRRALREVA
jgi:hypothetical protein